MIKRVAAKSSIVMTGLLMLAGNAFGLDQPVLFDTSAAGESKAITEWGLDTAWDNTDNIRRGAIFMGVDQVDYVRVAFPVDDQLSGGQLSAANKTEADNRIDHIGWAGLASKPLTMTTDTGAGVNNWYKSGSQVIPANWVQAMEATVNYYDSKGKTIVSAAPFNEPDYGWGQGTMQNLYDICNLLQSSPTFSGIAIAGGSTLNCDLAYGWYDYIKGVVDEGTTHQLGGSVDSYVSFYQYVLANGDKAVNEEIHNIGEAIIGAEYGLEEGIFWGSAERARAGFIKACQGDRLGYAENRPNWTAAAVYRAPGGAVQAFVGESERDARVTTYRFFSKDRPVFFDGHGPQRGYSVTTTGGPGYATADHHNAEKMVNITWGDDVQPAIDGQYYLINRNSGLVMTVANNSTTDGENIRQQNFFSGDNQKWDINPLPSTYDYGDYSYFTMTAAHSGKAADVSMSDPWPNWGYNDGVNVQQWTFGGGYNQEWYLEYVEDGWFHIRNRWSGKYLEVANASTVTTGNIRQNSHDSTTYGDDHHQQWRLLPVSAGDAFGVEFTAPAPPANVVASANAVSVQLNWTANAETDLDGYTVLRSTTSGGPYDIIARGVANNAYTDYSANQSIPYYYVIQAVDQSLNRSANSTQDSATPTGAPALVAEYGFEGDATDSSINGNDADLNGAADYFAGGVGASYISLDGTENYVSLPAEIVNHDQITIAAWVNWSGGDIWQRIFDFGNGTDEYMFLTPANWDGTTMQFTIHDNGVENSLYTSAPAVGQWTHVAVTISNSTAHLYVDGVSVDSSGSFTIKPSDFNPVLNYIGRSQFAADTLFSGGIDDFRIYNHALSATEVATLASSGIAPPAVLPIELVNPGFEEPDYGSKIYWGFDGSPDVPGWSESGAMYDSGIEAPGAGPGAYTGTYAAYMRGPVSWDSTPAYSAYQLTAHSIAAGDVFTVDFAAAANWIETSTGEMSVYLYYNNGGSRVVMDMVTVSGMTVGGGWTPGTLSVAADDHAASIGHEIGIEFKNTGNGWTSVDNFSLTVSNTVADTTAPGAPTALVATSGDGSVGLDWANNSEPDLDSYTVYRSTVSNGIYAVVASGLTASTNTDNTVTNGTKYYYVVTATDSNANESVFSSPPVGVVPSAAIAPAEYYIADMVVDAGTNLTLTVSNSVLGHTYWILAADELASPTVWSNIMDKAGTGSDVLFGIPIDPVSINRFFKLDVQRQ